MQYLFLMLGYPGSGKSTFSEQLAQDFGWLRFNTDEARRYMFTTEAETVDVKLNPYVNGALDYATEVALDAGFSVVNDSNHNLAQSRQKLKIVATQCGAKTIVIRMKTPLRVAKQREVNRRLESDYIAISDERYDVLVGLLEEPTNDELTISIDGEANYTDQLKSFKEQLDNINQ